MSDNQALQRIEPEQNDVIVHQPLPDAVYWQRLDHAQKWAWAAGFIDGEGCFGVYRERDKRKGEGYRQYRVSFSICNTHKYSLMRLAKVLEVRIKLVTTAKPRRNHKRRWQFAIRKQATLVRIIRNLLPYLIVKRCVAELMLKFCELRLSQRGKGRYAKHTEPELFLAECICKHNNRPKPTKWMLHERSLTKN